MDQLPALASGFVRIHLRLSRGDAKTPGELASWCGVPLEQVGPIAVAENGREAWVDVRLEAGRPARAQLERLGPTRLVDWQWQWLKLGIGRNHGLSMGQLRKIMHNADAGTVGRIHIQNTHTLVGLQDFKLGTVCERLSLSRINGYAVKPEALPLGKGPGSPAFTPGVRRPV